MNIQNRFVSISAKKTDGCLFLTAVSSTRFFFSSLLNPCSKEPLPRLRGGRFTRVTRHSLGIVVVLLGQLGEESQSASAKSIIV